MDLKGGAFGKPVPGQGTPGKGRARLPGQTAGGPPGASMTALSDGILSQLFLPALEDRGDPPDKGGQQAIDRKRV